MGLVPGMVLHESVYGSHTFQKACGRLEKAVIMQGKQPFNILLQVVNFRCMMEKKQVMSNILQIGIMGVLLGDDAA